MALIETKHIEKKFVQGDTTTVALHGIDISIERGEFVTIIGPSGSGKSTMLQILGLLDTPTSGTYLLDGNDTSTYSDDELASVRNKKMSFVFQSFNLLPRTSVLENVKLPLAYSTIPIQKWDELAKKHIDAVMLSHRSTHEPAELSGGERQRVAIARALVTDPDIIFADEPTGNLDSRSGSAVMEIFRELHKKNKTIVLITHDRAVARVAERALLIKDGEICWQGDASHIPE